MAALTSLVLSVEDLEDVSVAVRRGLVCAKTLNFSHLRSAKRTYDAFPFRASRASIKREVVQLTSALQPRQEVLIATSVFEKIPVLFRKQRRRDRGSPQIYLTISRAQHDTINRLQSIIDLYISWNSNAVLVICHEDHQEVKRDLLTASLV